MKQSGQKPAPNRLQGTTFQMDNNVVGSPNTSIYTSLKSVVFEDLNVKSNVFFMAVSFLVKTEGLNEDFIMKMGILYSNYLQTVKQCMSEINAFSTAHV